MTDSLEHLAGYALVVPPEDHPIRQLGLQPSVVVVMDSKMYFYDQVELDTFSVSIKKALQ